MSRVRSFASICIVSMFVLVVIPGCPPVGPEESDGTNGQDDLFSDPESPVFLVVTSEDSGETITFMGEKDSEGSPVHVTGAVYESAGGESFTVLVDSDGRPTEVVADGVVFQLSKWTSSTVDLIVIDTDGTMETFTLDLPEYLITTVMKPVTRQRRISGDDVRRIADVVSVVGCIMSVAEGVGVGLAAGWTGIGVAAAIGIVALGCDGAVAMAAGSELPSEYVDAKCLISVASGFVISKTACLSAGLNHWAEYLDAQDIVSFLPDGGGGETEILEVPGLGVPTVESATLESGQSYLIEVSGTYVIDTSNGRQADAEWSNYWGYLGDQTWYENPADENPSVTHPDLLDLLIDGATVDWLGTTDGANFAPHTYSPTHVYHYEVVGAGAPIEFQIADPGPSQPWDNSGSLVVSITPVP
jgi:hypothetical protein